MKKPKKNVDLILVIGMLIVLAVTLYLIFNPLRT